METTTKSRFVSFLAVFLIICSILGILIVSAQLILFYKFTNLEQFKNMANQALLMGMLPPFLAYILQYAVSIIWAFLVYVVLALIISIAFYKRKPWARIAMIGFFIWKALLWLVCFVFSWKLYQHFSNLFPLSNEYIIWIKVIILGGNIAAGAIQFWILYKLFSRRVAIEFGTRKLNSLP
jgi:hypothetical protein